MSTPLRIANCSGFYGDRLSAAREMVEGGPIDFLTGDYLAELTMMILWKARQKDASRGYAVTFLKQMEDVLGEALDSRHQDRHQRRRTQSGGIDDGTASALRSAGSEGEDSPHRGRRPDAAARVAAKGGTRAEASRHRAGRCASCGPSRSVPTPIWALGASSRH